METPPGWTASTGFRSLIFQKPGILIYFQRRVCFGAPGCPPHGPICLDIKDSNEVDWKGILAERGGFEPPSGYYPEHAFQACDLNHSSTSPRAAHHTGSACIRQIEVEIPGLAPLRQKKWPAPLESRSFTPNSSREPIGSPHAGRTRH